MANILNIDGSAELHITGAKTGHSIKIEFEFFEDDGITPIAVPGTVAMQFWSDGARQNKFINYSTDDALNITGNKLTLFLTKAANKFKAHKYLYNFYSDLSAQESAPLISGSFKVEAAR